MKWKFLNFCCSVWWRPMLQDTALRLDQEKSSFWSLDYDVLKDLMEDYPLPNTPMLVRFAFQFWSLWFVPKSNEWKIMPVNCQGIPCPFEIPYCVTIRFYCCHENKSFRSQVSKERPLVLVLRRKQPRKNLAFAIIRLQGSIKSDIEEKVVEWKNKAVKCLKTQDLGYIHQGSLWPFLTLLCMRTVSLAWNWSFFSRWFRWYEQCFSWEIVQYSGQRHSCARLCDLL